MKDVLLTALRQSLRLGYWLLLAATLLAAGFWLTRHIRPVPFGQQAVVTRFGAINRVQYAGLLLAWPSPMEEVHWLPAPERVLQRELTLLDRPATAQSMDDTNTPLQQMGDDLAGAGFVLTGDFGVLQLHLTLNYSIADAMDYARQQERALAVLDQEAGAAVIALCAGRRLDVLLPSGVADRDTGLAAQRAELLARMAAATNLRLQALAQRGAATGLKVVRVDIQSAPPQAAKPAFDAVLSSEQAVLSQQAQAATDAALTRQRATADVAATLAGAKAKADERVALARNETSAIPAFEARLGQQDGPAYLLQMYSEKIKAILAKAGQVTTLDGPVGGKTILSGQAR